MAEELKIQVKAEGAMMAANELYAVAAAEGQVISAIGPASVGMAKHTEHAAKASEAMRSFGIRNVNVLNSLKQLGPEFAVAADLIGTLVNRATTAGVTLGILGAAISAVAIGVRAYGASQDEEARKASEVLRALKEQHDAYMDIATAVDQASAAERRLRGDRAVAQAPGPIVKRLASAARLGPDTSSLGAEGLKVGAAAMASAQAGGETISDAQVAAFADWLALGMDNGAADPGHRWRMFLASYTPAQAAQWKKVLAANVAANPQAFRASGVSAAGIVSGMSPSGQAEAALENVAVMETQAGRARKSKDVRNYLEDLLTNLEQYSQRGKSTGINPDENIAGLRDLIGSYPQLGDVQTTPGYRPMLLGKNRSVVTAGQSGQTVSQYINSYSGGTHYHGQMQDPAGGVRQAPR